MLYRDFSSFLVTGLVATSTLVHAGRCLSVLVDCSYDHSLSYFVKLRPLEVLSSHQGRLMHL
jgi:hypothetical protein